MSIKITNIKMIEVQAWDRLVCETYGKPYSFQQQDDCKGRGIHNITIPCDYADEEDSEMNDSIPFVINGKEMGVQFKTWLNTTEEDVNSESPESYPGANNLIWERNFYPCVEIIANDLHKKGLIEAGDYTINIDW